MFPCLKKFLTNSPLILSIGTHSRSLFSRLLHSQQHRHRRSLLHQISQSLQSSRRRFRRSYILHTFPPLILFLDHGNGTEEILQGHDEFLFISIHVGEIYPGTGAESSSRASNVLNISLQPDDGSEIFRRAFDTKILPRLEEYKPDILLLSSGFDGHKRDPTGN